jgi:Na+/melibiose symporter-like transporter
MKKIKSRKLLALYGCSGMGVNMMNLMVGSYLCSALITGGFAPEDIGTWTYIDKSLVVATLWAALAFVARVLDGIIDLPFASFTDRLKTRWGRRRPSLVIGFVPMVIAYLLFLVPLNQGETVLNTIWFGVLLMVFYAFYTLTMLTFYATFSEVTETEGDVVFLSNVKSVCDVVYFILGYALVPVFVGMGINIRYVALIFLPLSLLMLIPMFLLKEEPTNKPAPVREGEVAEKPLTLWKAIAVSVKNKNFIYWMCTAAVMNFGLQLFLGGINELFSSTGLNMTVVMASSFVPFRPKAITPQVPFGMYF